MEQQAAEGEPQMKYGGVLKAKNGINLGDIFKRKNVDEKERLTKKLERSKRQSDRITKRADRLEDRVTKSEAELKPKEERLQEIKDALPKIKINLNKKTYGGKIMASDGLVDGGGGGFKLPKIRLPKINFGNKNQNNTDTNINLVRGFANG